MASALDITRRAFIGTLGVAAAGYAAWPVRPRHLATAPRGRREIVYWEKWTGVEGAAVQAAVDAFNESQSEVWVRRMAVSDIVTKTLIAMAGDDPPDVAGLFDFNLPQLVESNAIMPLDGFADPIAPKATYAQPIWRRIAFDDRPWAGVTTCHSIAVYYDRAACRAAGLDPDCPARTIAEFEEAADALTIRGPGDALERAGFLPNLPNWWPYFWVVPFDAPIWDEATNQARLLDPRTVAAYEWVGSWPDRYGRDHVETFGAGYGRSFLTAQDPFLSGRVAMVVQGPWMANFIRQFVPEFEYGCMPIPEQAPVDQPTGTLEADVLVIPRGAKDPEAAAAFVRFMQQPEIIETLAQAHAKPTPLAHTSPSFAANHPNRAVAVHDAIVRSPRVRTAPATRTWPQFSRLIGTAFQSIWNGGDVQGALTTANDHAQGLLDRAAEMRSRRTA